VELIDHLRLVGRRWTWIVAGILLGALAAGGWAYLSPRSYPSSTALIVGSVLNGQNDSGGGSYSASQFVLGRMSTYAQLVDSPDIATSVDTRVGLGLSAAQFADSVTATVPPGTVLLRVTAHAATPEHAQDLAGATADAKLSAPRLACARYYVPLRVLGRNGENMQREHGSTYIVWYYQTSPLFWLSCSPSALS
jgi:capsular polysaccharide biosynthesis protein